MFNYYKIEEQHVEQVSEYLKEKEIPFTNVSNPLKYVCENEVNTYIENQQEELKPLFRKIENHMIEYMYDNFGSNQMISIGIQTIMAKAVDEIIEGE